MAPLDSSLHRAQMLRRSLLVLVVAARSSPWHTGPRYPCCWHSGMLRLITLNELESMNNESFNIGDKVIVSATATGTGEDMPGVVESVETVLGWPIVSVVYLQPSAIGTRGITLSNLGLITKVPTHGEI